jgi:hypothetical protein
MPLMSNGGSHRRTSSAAVVVPDMTGSVRCRGVEGQMSMTADGFLEYHPAEVRNSVTIEVFATAKPVKIGTCDVKNSMSKHVQGWGKAQVENSWPSGDVEVCIETTVFEGWSQGRISCWEACYNLFYYFYM